jgi:D-tyrosyl-tRNA(Tyr) deacylase
VSEAEVRVGHEVVAGITRGLVVFVCAMDGDGEEEAAFLARKIARLRVFADDAGKTNLSLAEVAGAVLVVSQFTLAADWRKGNRPGFSRAAEPKTAEALYESFCDVLADQGVAVEKGHFGAMMKVNLVNEGPFTIWMDSDQPLS